MLAALLEMIARHRSDHARTFTLGGDGHDPLSQMRDAALCPRAVTTRDTWGASTARENTPAMMIAIPRRGRRQHGCSQREVRFVAAETNAAEPVVRATHHEQRE